MLVTVSSQAYIFLCAIVGGILIAFIYDIFRVKRRAVKTSLILIYVEDLVFWIIVAVVMFAVLYFGNEGEIRGYIFIGSIMGIILYNLVFSKIVMAAFLFVLKILYRTVRFLWRLLTYPFILIYRLLLFPARSAGRAGRKVYRGVKGAGKNRIVRLSIWGRRMKNIKKKI